MAEPKITSIIAHIDHGKTTLIDSLIASTGYFSKSLIGELRYLDSRKDEQMREITMKLGPIKLGNKHVFIDTPGHVDFEDLIFSSTILSDNHIILIDVNEGITPRTNSLIKFVNKDRCILAVNKIDRCTDYKCIENVVMQMNGLFGDEVFEWSKNNIILGAAVLGAGVCSSTFKYSSKNTLRQAFRTFKALDEKIDRKDIDEIIKKYEIKFVNKKIVFNAVMPFYTCVFETVEQIYTRVGQDNLQSDLSSMCLAGQVRDRKMHIDTPFYTIEAAKTPELLGITVYGIFKDKNNFSYENVLFLVRLLSGTLRVGDTVYSSDSVQHRQATIQAIYDFSIDTYIEIESFAGPGLVFVRADILKNSCISSAVVDFRLKQCLFPFYYAKMVLSDIKLIDDAKRVIKVISLTEQNLKVRLNRFSEFEFRCGGRVQFEKICFDLEEHGLDFQVTRSDRNFKECAGAIARKACRLPAFSFEIAVGPVSQLDDELDRYAGNGWNRIDSRSNVYFFPGDDNSNVIESVLGLFTLTGPVIREEIINTFFVVKVEHINARNIFSALRNELEDVYMASSPFICPLCFRVDFSVTRGLLSAVYTCLQKTAHEVENENYKEDSDFITIACRVPQPLFNQLAEEVMKHTKGTAYLEVVGSEYHNIGNFSNLITEIRKEKGMYVPEKIVEDPEKQRTLRR